MSKALIVSHQGGGRYIVTDVYRTLRVDAEIAGLGAKIATLDGTKIPELKLALAEALGEYNDLRDAYDDAIVDLVWCKANGPACALQYCTEQGTCGDCLENVGTEEYPVWQPSLSCIESTIATKRRLVLEEQQKLLEPAAKVKAAKLDLLQAYAYRSQLAKLANDLADQRVASVNKTVWCADLSDGKCGRSLLTGQVGLINLFHHPRHGSVLPPGNCDTLGAMHYFACSEHGQMHTAVDATPAAAAYEYATTLGNESWRPQWMAGVIVSKGSGYCFVEITFPNGRVETWDCDIYYLDCNSSAFGVGDEVLVRERDRDAVPPQGRVLGFVNGPKRCPFRLRFSGSTSNNVRGPVSSLTCLAYCEDMQYDYATISGTRTTREDMTGTTTRKVVFDCENFDVEFVGTHTSETMETGQCSAPPGRPCAPRPGGRQSTQKTRTKTEVVIDGVVIGTVYDYKSSTDYSGSWGAGGPLSNPGGAVARSHAQWTKEAWIYTYMCTSGRSYAGRRTLESYNVVLRVNYPSGGWKSGTQTLLVEDLIVEHGSIVSRTEITNTVTNYDEYYYADQLQSTFCGDRQDWTCAQGVSIQTKSAGMIPTNVTALAGGCGS